MNMTRDEIIKEYEAAVAAHAAAAAAGIKGARKSYELFKAGLDALRPVSRERVEKVWKGEWIIPTIIGGRAYNIPHCSACNGVPCGTDEHTRFCAHCGAPMTDEAVEMVMERLNKLEETKK